MEEKEKAEAMLVILMRSVAEANRSGERIYSLHYYGGKWIEITVREKTFGESRVVVKKDTRVNVENLTAAIKAMEAEACA